MKVGLPQLIAIGLILAVWLFNVRGVRVGVSFGYLAGALLMVPLFVMMILPFLNGSFDSANLDNTIKATDSGMGRPPALDRLVMADVLVGLGGGRLCDLRSRVQGHGARHEARAALRGAVLALRLHPAADRLRRRRHAELVSAYDYVGAMDQIVGSTTLTDFFVVCLVAAFIITMNTATADGGRALYGISRAGMTVKQLGTLNRWHVPGNAMTVDMVINILFVLFIGNIFGVLAAANLGYVLAHMFALSGFVLLARDRPDWPRPIRLGVIWMPIAAILALWCLHSSRSSASAGCRSRRAATATRRRRSSACRVLVISLPALPLPADRAGQGERRTGVRRRRRCRTRAKRRSSQEEMRPA